MSKQNKDLTCPVCNAPALHPSLKIPKSDTPRVLIFQNKEGEGVHQCLVCAGMYEEKTFKDTWQNYSTDIGFFEEEAATRTIAEFAIRDADTGCRHIVEVTGDGTTSTVSFGSSFRICLDRAAAERLVTELSVGIG